MKTDVRRLSGAMNLDHDPDFIADGDYVEAWNSTSYRGLNSEGRLFNLLGTELNGYTYGGSGVRTINGTAEDRPNNHLYYFVHSTVDADFIIQHNVLTKANVLVYTSTILALDLDYPVQGIVVSGRLIWTDNNTGPRALDIERAINFSAGSGTPIYASIDEAVLDFVRRPPNEAPIPTFGQDTARVQNNVYGKIFQFSYVNVYFDKSKSVFGPYSDIIIPAGEELSTGLQEEDSTLNNYISVKCYDGPDIVTKVELYVRELRNDEAVGFWSLIKTFERGVDTITADYYTFVFINDGGVQIDINESLRPYDFVPRLAKSLSVIDSSRVLFGNYKSGYDQVTPDVALSYSHTTLANSIGTAATGAVTVEQIEETFEYGRDPEIEQEYVRITINIVYEGKEYILTYDEATYSYTALAGDSVSDIAAGLVAAAVAGGETIIATSAGAGVFQVGDIENQANEGGDNITCSVAGMPSTGTVLKAKTFKRGALHPLGILYRDLQGRPLSVSKNDSTSLYIPFSTEQMEAGTLGAITGPNYYTRIDYDITHLPPANAATWQWAYMKNNLLWWDQYTVTSIKYITEAIENPRVAIDVNSNLIANEAFSTMNKAEIYTYTEGDRLRVITKDGALLISAYVDLLIHGIHTDGDGVEFVIVDRFDFNTLNIGDGSTVEIYRPDYEVRAVEDSEVSTDYDEQHRIHYFGIGPISEVYDSGGTMYHRGTTQDQTGAQNALGYLASGDAYQRVRFFYDASMHIESSAMSDNYDSEAYHKDRLVIYDTNQKETTYEHGLFHGGQNDDLTDNYNKTFSFDYDGFMHDLAVNDGPIVKLVTVGDILKVFQRSKVSSIYIGRDAAITATGEEILRTSNEVLGSIRPSVDDFGTTFPESVFVDGTTIYYYDAYSKKLLANTPSGNVDLGEKGNVARYFIDLSNAVLASTMANIKVFIAKDRFNQIFIAIKDSTSESTLPRAITFYPPKVQFKAFHDLTAEWVAGWEKVVSFVAGALWVHNETTSYGLIHGSQVEQTIKVVTKADPRVAKNYLTILLDTTHNERITGKTYDAAARALMWSSKTKGDLEIVATAANASGKQTRLLPMRWERKKDHLFCTIPPDMNDPAYPDDSESLMNGRPMVGKTLFVLVRNEGTTNIDIESISINYITD